MTEAPDFGFELRGTDGKARLGELWGEVEK